MSANLRFERITIRPLRVRPPAPILLTLYARLPSLQIALRDRETAHGLLRRRLCGLAFAFLLAA